MIFSRRLLRGRKRGARRVLPGRVPRQGGGGARLCGRQRASRSYHRPALSPAEGPQGGAETLLFGRGAEKTRQEQRTQVRC